MMMMMVMVLVLLLWLMMLWHLARFRCRRWSLSRLTEEIQQIVHLGRPALGLMGGRHHLGGGAVGASTAAIQVCRCHRLLQLLELLPLLMGLVVVAGGGLLAGQKSALRPMGGPVQVLMGGGAVVDGLALGAAQQLLLGAADGAAGCVHG